MRAAKGFIHMTRRQMLAGAAALGGTSVSPVLWNSNAHAQTTRLLTYGISTYPPNFRPFDFSGAAGRTVRLLIHRGLLSFGADGQIHPEVAESWEFTNPTTYTFKLRDNAYFHNGDPITPEDVKHSLAQIVSPQSTAFFREDFKVVDRVEAPSKDTVVITLKEPVGSFAAMLANAHSPIISAKGGAGAVDQSAGCGPFILDQAEKGVSMSFAANQRFYKEGLPKAGGLRVVVYADDSLRVSALQAGDVDIIEYVPWQSMKRIASDANLTLRSAKAAYMYLVFNTTTGPFSDARVRRAVAHAIKREDIVKAVFLGEGEPLSGLPIEASSPFYDKETAELWGYDPDKGKALLKEAGASNVTVSFLATSTYGMHKDAAEIIQQHLAAVGMRVTLNLPEWGARVALGNQGRYQFALNGGGSNFRDPDELSALIGSSSPSFLRSFGPVSKGIDEKLAKARHQVGEAERRATYADLSRLVREETPICPLAYRNDAYGMRKSVTDFQTLPGLLFLSSGNGFDTAYLAD